MTMSAITTKCHFHGRELSSDQQLVCICNHGRTSLTVSKFTLHRDSWHHSTWMHTFHCLGLALQSPWWNQTTEIPSLLQKYQITTLVDKLSDYNFINTNMPNIDQSTGRQNLQRKNINITGMKHTAQKQSKHGNENTQNVALMTTKGQKHRNLNNLLCIYIDNIWINRIVFSRTDWFLHFH